MGRSFSSRFLSARAFTLVELLVVILVIGILIAVAAPSFLGQTQKAEDSAAKQYLTVAYKAAKAYSTDGNGAPGHVQGNFDGFDQTALQAIEPGLTASAGACPADAAGDPHTNITIDTASGNNLVICNDPEDRVWALEVQAGVLQDLSLYLCEDGVCALESGPGVTSSADTTLPLVSVTAPVDAATVSGLVSVTANASDNVGVVGVQFKLDGVNLGVEDASAPYSVSWDTATASNGAHVLTAVARDAANNTQTATNVNVTVSNISSYTATVLSDSPRVYYPLDDNDVSAPYEYADDSGNSDPPLSGTFTAYGDGPFPLPTNDTAPRFSSFNDHFSRAGAAFSRQDNLTLEAWFFFPNAITYERVLVANGDAYNGAGYAMVAYPSAAGTAVVAMKFNGATVGAGQAASVSLNAWHHFAMVRSGGTWTLYADGTPVPATSTVTPNVPATSFTIGGTAHANRGGTGAAGARIAQVAYYESALSQARLQAHYADIALGP